MLKLIRKVKKVNQLFLWEAIFNRHQWAYAFILGNFIILSSCNTNQTNYSKYKILSEHKGTENFEIIQIIPNYSGVYEDGTLKFDKNRKDNCGISNIEVDTIANKIKIYSYYEFSEYIVIGNDKYNKGEEIRNTIIVDQKGEVEASYPYGNVQGNGTLLGYNYYSNLFVNGDKKMYKFKYPFTEQEKNDPKRWIQKFKELYNKSTYAYLFKWYGSVHYFYIDGKWNFGYSFRILTDSIERQMEMQFKDKDIEVERTVALTDLKPYFLTKPEQKITGAKKEIGFEIVDFKIDDNYDYNAMGWYYMNIYMPKGDVIRIKRFGKAQDPHINLYKVHQKYGGNEDVLFIEFDDQDRELNHQGLYIIKPRNLTK